MSDDRTPAPSVAVAVAVAAATARMLRGVLDEIAAPDSELTASAATRHRIEGAALALDAAARVVRPGPAR